MDLNIYKDGDIGRTKIIFNVDDADRIKSIEVGNRVVSTKTGFQFYVDDYVAEQIEKCELYIDGLMPRLKVKDGEKLYIPTDVE